MSAPPTRLIILVDGLWKTPDSPSTVVGTSTDETIQYRVDGNAGIQDFVRNPSNIYRLYTSIEHGVCGHGDQKVIQKVVCINGIGGSDNISFTKRLISNSFGEGVEDQIRQVYKLCCELPADTRNEIWLFGFSRGAFVVRAVAALLCRYGALKSVAQTGFDEDFRLVVNSSRRKSNPNVNEINKKLRMSSPIKFIGVFDTVRPHFDNDSCYDISLFANTEHVRHAIALNELRRPFQVERFGEKSPLSHATGRSKIEAWFIGSHDDLGGANEQDGLSLYPLQWMILESQKFGLRYRFQKPTGQLESMLDPLELTRCDSVTDTESLLFVARNGITTELKDMRSNHVNPQLAVKLNQKATGWVLPRARKPFLGDEIIDYRPAVPRGTILHPSIYLLIQNYVQLANSIRDSGFLPKIANQWENMCTGKIELWAKAPDDIADRPADVVRILVCGNAGIGKSSLINSVFGEVKTAHSDLHMGIHDVNSPLQAKSRPSVLIHDSEGFEAGSSEQLTIIENFIKTRCDEHLNYSEKLHAIWFCMDTSDTRPLQGGTRKIFELVSQTAERVPVIIVGTRKDVFDDDIWAKSFKAAKIASPKKSMDSLTEIADKRVRDALLKRQKDLETLLLEVDVARYEAIIFVSTTDPKDVHTIQELLDRTAKCLDNKNVQQHLVSGQVINMATKIERAITASVRLYGHATRSAIPASLIPLASTAAKHTIGHLVIRQVFDIFGVGYLYEKVLMPLRRKIWPDIESVAEVFAAEFKIVATWVTLKLPTMHITVIAKYILKMAIDTILILCYSLDATTDGRDAHEGLEIGRLTPELIISSAEAYKEKSIDVHQAIEHLVRTSSELSSLFNYVAIEDRIKILVKHHNPLTHESATGRVKTMKKILEKRNALPNNIGETAKLKGKVELPGLNQDDVQRADPEQTTLESASAAENIKHTDFATSKQNAVTEHKKTRKTLIAHTAATKFKTQSTLMLETNTASASSNHSNSSSESDRQVHPRKSASRKQQTTTRSHRHHKSSTTTSKPVKHARKDPESTPDTSAAPPPKDNVPPTTAMGIMQEVVDLGNNMASMASSIMTTVTGFRALKAPDTTTAAPQAAQVGGAPLADAPPTSGNIRHAAPIGSYPDETDDDVEQAEDENDDPEEQDDHDPAEDDDEADEAQEEDDDEEEDEANEDQEQASEEDDQDEYEDTEDNQANEDEYDDLDDGTGYI